MRTTGDLEMKSFSGASAVPEASSRKAANAAARKQPAIKSSPPAAAAAGSVGSKSRAPSIHKHRHSVKHVVTSSSKTAEFNENGVLAVVTIEVSGEAAGDAAAVNWPSGRKNSVFDGIANPHAITWRSDFIIDPEGAFAQIWNL